MSLLLLHHAMGAVIAQNNGLLPDATFARPFVPPAAGGNSYDRWAATDRNVWLQNTGGAYTVNASASEYLYMDHYMPGGSYQTITHVTSLTGSLRIVGAQGDMTVTAPGIYTQTFTAGSSPGSITTARFHFQCYAGTTCQIKKFILKTA